MRRHPSSGIAEVRAIVHALGPRLAIGAAQADGAAMDIDALLFHYFGSDDPDAIDDAAFQRGQDRLTLDFAVEREPGRRFALWTLMEVFGIAPPPAEAFKDPVKDASLRRAAEDYLTAAWKLEKD